MTWNPVLHRELVMRLRLRQVPVGVKIGLGVVVLTAMVLFYGTIGRLLLDNPKEDVGMLAWGWCAGIQYILVCLVAPVITANCITQEREQQTWDMLVFSRLKPREIILGKLISRLAVVFLVLALFLPLTAFCWLHAAVMDMHSTAASHIAAFLLVYAVMFISTVFFATCGLFISWQLRKTLYAIMLSYTFVIGFLLIGTTLICFMLQTRFSDGSFPVRFPLMWINPGYLLGYALAPDNAANSTRYVLCGLACYIVATLFMLWRMISAFYGFAYDDDGASAGTLSGRSGHLALFKPRSCAQPMASPTAHDEPAPAALPGVRD